MKKKKQIGSLEDRYKAFTEGKGEIPVVYRQVKFTLDGEMPIAILTREIVDRDGEVVMVDGIEVEDAEKGVPLLDAHNQWGSVVTNVLGRIVSIQKEEKDNVKELRGIIKFANTPVGQLAKTLVMDEIVDSVSIGFGVKKYEPDTKTILESELYETSLVAVPANPEAKIEVSKNATVDSQVKKLARYDEIKTAFKEFTKTFFSDEFTQRLEMEKTDDLVMDIAKMYTIVDEKLAQLEALTTSKDTEVEEDPKPAKKGITQNELQERVNVIVDKHLQQE